MLSELRNRGPRTRTPRVARLCTYVHDITLRCMQCQMVLIVDKQGHFGDSFGTLCDAWDFLMDISGSRTDKLHKEFVSMKPKDNR